MSPELNAEERWAPSLLPRQSGGFGFMQQSRAPVEGQLVSEKERHSESEGLGPGHGSAGSPSAELGG